MDRFRPALVATVAATKDLLPASYAEGHTVKCSIPVVVILVISAILGGCSVASPDQQPTESISACVDRIAPKMQSGQPSVDDFFHAASFCQTIIGAQQRSNEQAIRAQNYIFQRSENVVLMWMVVSITIAGVVLAGLQLWTSYLLASAGRRNAAIAIDPSKDSSAGDLPPALGLQGTVEFSKDKLAVQSSVVGVIVLAISFAFFLVFVLYVYTFQEPKKAATDALDGGAPVQLREGKLVPNTTPQGPGGTGKQ